MAAEQAMQANEYRIESNHQILGPLMSPSGVAQIRLKSRDLAVSVAAKCFTAPYGQEIRVVHVDSGEVVFRKTVTTPTPCTES